MQKFVFLFGRDPTLSLAELVCFLRARKKEFRLEESPQGAAILAFSENIDADYFQSRLGGTTRIARVLFETNGATEKEFSKKLEASRVLEGLGKKFFYGVSALVCSEEEIEALKGAIKKGFKERGYKASFKPPKFHGEEEAPTVLNPSDVLRWEMLNKGAEFLLLKVADGFVAAKSISCFNPEELEERDEMRPATKPLEAISLRLARIMLNLAGATEEKVVLDPFCGVGSILQEALVNGCKRAIGIDLDEKKVPACQKNLSWIAKRQESKTNWRVLQGDSTKLSSLVKKGDFDCVVSEPYLGPLIDHSLREEEAQKIVAALSRLYSAFFRSLALLVSGREPVCFILPSIPSRERNGFVPVPESVFREQGFVSLQPLQGIKDNAFPYSYKTKKSKILRRIFLLQKKG